MVEDSGRRGRVTGLTDRLSERAVFGQLVEAVRAGESRALVVRGEPGVGNTILETRVLWIPVTVQAAMLSDSELLVSRANSEPR